MHIRKRDILNCGQKGYQRLVLPGFVFSNICRWFIKFNQKKNVSPYFVDPLKQAKYEWKNTTDMSMVSIQICMGVPAVFTNIFVEKFDHHGYIQILLFEKTALKTE